jgi:predicted RNA-binding protein with RPS1 domain
MQIPTDKIREVIGSGGKVIREIVEVSGAKVDINDDGIIKIASPNGDAIQKAYDMIHSIVAEPEEGKIYKGKVVKIVDFGAFVNFFGKRDGLVHVSQIENRRLNHPSDVLKEGQEVWVKLLGFDDRGKVRLAMKMVDQETGGLHDGEQGGKGRRNWTTEQKARFSGGGRQKTAVDVLDRAERVGLISTGSRRGATSHMERLLRNPAVKEFLGIRKDPDTDAIQTTRHPDEFDKLLQHIVEEAQNKKLGSQATSAKIKDWINTLRAEIGPSDTYVDPYLITDPNTISPSARGSKIEGNTKGPANRIRKAIEIQKALQSYGNTKLRDLYRSICGVSLTEHPLLVSVGIWSFLDTLAANQGKSPQTAFNSYFSGEWMKANGLGGKNDAKGMSNALKNLCDGGNITKHDKVAAHYDSRQMANDMEVLTPLIVKALQKKATP